MNIWMMLFQVFNAVSAIYIYCLFFGAFSEKREFKSRNLALIGLAIIWSAVLIFMPASTIRMIIIFLLILLLSFVYRNDWYKNLLLSLLVFCLPALIEIIVVMTITILGISVSEADQNIYLVIGTLISKVLTFTCIQFVRSGKHKLRNISIWYYLTFGLLAICSTLISIIVLDYVFLNHRILLKIIAIISVWLLIGADVLIFYVIDRIHNLHIAEQNLLISQKLLKEQKIHYENVIDEQKHIAKIKHDIKNSLIGVLSEYNNGNDSYAKQKLEFMFEEINRQGADIMCKDVALNTVLTIKKNDATQNGIKLEYIDNISSQINIDPIDLCVMIGNLLDNAIEACKLISRKEKFISVFTASSTNNLIVSVKNDISNKVDTNNLTTSKSNKKHHGLGLSRVRELVEKYNGNIDINCTDSSFEVNIIISNE